MLEIERKFLVAKDKWDEVLKSSFATISQAYIVNSKEKTVRIRIKDTKAFLTIKGETKGVTRTEFEFEIPVNQAISMLEIFQLKVLKKKRFEIWFKNTLWEVDVFEDGLSGLIIAEVELETEEATYEKPSWIGEEVSHLPEYYNANLISRL
ncbi:MAG: CYTH domain-containing protein [Crocinitomicaceae bacterium]|nr:CYTH domain-containing protein [Crocinitomicaceae bacterium]